MVPAVDEMWVELAAEGLSSPKSNALAAWRFEPCSILNDESKQGGWIGQSWQQREMDCLTLAMQRELSSSSRRNENDNKKKIKKTLQVSDSSMASSGTGFNALMIPFSSSSPRHFEAVGLPVVGSVADTTRAISHLVAPDGSNDGRALLAPVGNKNHPLTTISGGKVSKPRRSRASSKSPIKFLAADPANFRAMVQQVTGVLDRILSPDQYSRASRGESQFPVCSAMKMKAVGEEGHSIQKENQEEQ